MCFGNSSSIAVLNEDGIQVLGEPEGFWSEKVVSCNVLHYSNDKIDDLLILKLYITPQGFKEDIFLVNIWKSNYSVDGFLLMLCILHFTKR